MQSNNPPSQCPRSTWTCKLDQRCSHSLMDHRSQLHEITVDWCCPLNWYANEKFMQHISMGRNCTHPHTHTSIDWFDLRQQLRSIQDELYLNIWSSDHLIIWSSDIGLDKVTTMMAITMVATTSAMTMVKMRIQACANVIIHGDVPATMETTMTSCTNRLLHQRKSTRVSTADRTMAPIRDVIVIVPKTSLNFVKNSMKIYPNKM